MDNTRIRVTPVTEAQKVTGTIMDTIIVTPDLVSSWEKAPSQRELRVNDTVLGLCEELKTNGGVLPGVITLGRIGGTTYLLDGQHRREAFLLSGMLEGYADIRVHRFDNLGELGREFVRLNSRIVNMTSDDYLRGLELSVPGLEKIKKRCPFVGYDHIRHSEKAPILSMSSTLRCWFGSAPEVPTGAGLSASKLAHNLTLDDAEGIIEFLSMAFHAWGKDASYRLLWRNLNLTVTAWLYRRVVVTQYSPATTRITKDQYTKCLMSLSASKSYLDWLAGRQLTNRDRAPCYNRAKIIFAERIQTDMGKKARLPSPSWSHA